MPSACAWVLALLYISAFLSFLIQYITHFFIYKTKGPSLSSLYAWHADRLVSVWTVDRYLMTTKYHTDDIIQRPSEGRHTTTCLIKKYLYIKNKTKNNNKKNLPVILFFFYFWTVFYVGLRSCHLRWVWICDGDSDEEWRERNSLLLTKRGPFGLLASTRCAIILIENVEGGRGGGTRASMKYSSLWHIVHPPPDSMADEAVFVFLIIILNT